LSENSNRTGDADPSNIKTKKVVAVLLVIGLVVLGLYLYKFRYGLSNDNGDWGTFGDYVGGILNPVIAGFAFYLIAKTYELQKRELEATRKLLKESTDAQKNQIKLAALTALLNFNLMRIRELESVKASLLQGTLIESEIPIKRYSTEYFSRLDKVDSEISNLINKNSKLEEQIRSFL